MSSTEFLRAGRWRILIPSVVDFDFLVVALTRLRRAAGLAAKVPEIANELANAIKEVDAALPHLKQLRDVAEHFDDYAEDDGRLKSIARQQLEVSRIDREGPTLEWLGHRLNASEALSASQQLFRVIQGVAPQVPPGASQRLHQPAA